MNTILCGDALKMLKTLPDCCATACVTSPPYYGLRDYGVDGQIGIEQTPDEYVMRLVEVFREARRVLIPEGTFWLNISDSYAGSGKGAWSKDIAERPKTKQRYIYDTGDPAAHIPKTWPDVKPKDMIGIPWRLAFALRSDGWYLRSDIIWHKPNAMPESAKDRPTQSYEHIFLFAKSHKYYYDHEAIKEPVADGTIARMKRGVSDRHKYSNGAPGQAAHTMLRPRPNRSGEDIDIPATRNKRDVWSVPTRPNREANAHFAVFPVELIKPCILAGCPAGGVVIDPFFGSGTTGAAAIELDRQYIGIDINPEYCRLADTRLRGGDNQT